MSDDYAEYERQCKRIRRENAKLLEAFADWLTANRYTVRGEPQVMPVAVEIAVPG